MGKFDPIIEKYRLKGVSAGNIEYAILAVKEGAKREYIIKDLTADYRGMSYQQAIVLLEDLFAANGGEFKKENRVGYLYGAFFLMIGLACSYYIYHVFTLGGVLVRPVYVFAGAIFGTLSGLLFLIKSLLGKYRESDEPFNY